MRDDSSGPILEYCRPIAPGKRSWVDTMHLSVPGVLLTGLGFLGVSLGIWLEGQFIVAALGGVILVAAGVPMLFAWRRAIAKHTSKP